MEQRRQRVKEGRTLGRMAFCAYPTSKPTIIVPTALNIRHRLVFIQHVKPPEERECVHGAIQEPCVDLAESVSCKNTGGLLEGKDDWSKSRAIERLAK